jgi:hypothetical protein
LPATQAIKKAIESTRLEQEPAVQELYGAIIYLAGAVILRSEKVDKKEKPDWADPYWYR